MLESKTCRHPPVVEQIFILAVRLQRYFLSRIHAKSILGWLPGLVLGVLSIYHLGTLSGQPHQRIPLSTGSAASEHGEVMFVLPGPVLGSEAESLNMLVPSAKTTRIEADGWTSAPECPNRIHDILEQKIVEIDLEYWFLTSCHLNDICCQFNKTSFGICNTCFMV